MDYIFIILLAAGIFLYGAFRKPSGATEATAQDEDSMPLLDHDDDWTTFNVQRAELDDGYAKAWGYKSDLDD